MTNWRRAMAQVVLVIATVTLVVYFGLALALQFFLPPPSSAWLWVPSVCALAIIWATSVLQTDRK